jgi:hypothetical protein
MAFPHGTSLRVRTCTRCALPFTTDGPYLRGLCPGCVTLVVTCWSEGRYRRILTELASAAALREGPAALVAALRRAIVGVADAGPPAIYFFDDRHAALHAIAAGPDTPAVLPAFMADAVRDCVGPVATIALAERDVRIASICTGHKWTMALPLRGEDDVLAVAFFGCVAATAPSKPEDLAYLALTASAVGAGLARARAVGLAALPVRPAPRRWDRATVQRLGWLL